MCVFVLFCSVVVVVVVVVLFVVGKQQHCRYVVIDAMGLFEELDFGRRA